MAYETIRDKSYEALQEYGKLRQHSAEQRLEFEKLLNYTNLLLATVRHLTAMYDGNIPPEVSNARIFLTKAPFELFKDEYTALVKSKLKKESV